MARRMSITGIDGLHRALRTLPKEASVELRDESQDIANDVAAKAKSRAMGVSATYATYVAPTIRARRDRIPVIAIGSKRRIRKGNARQVVGELLWGTEFGGGAFPTTRQFLPHLGTTGYALWPTIREELPDIMDRWADALYDAVIDSARAGGAS
jgi:hypothetical protein